MVRLLPFAAFKSAVLGFLSFAFGAFFDAHVLQFAGLENFAALEALHEFSVLIAAYDLHARVFAGLLIRILRLEERL